MSWATPPAAGGPHLPGAAQSVADCEAVRTERIGDHTVVFGEVVGVTSYPSAHGPLLYGLRRYATWPPSGPAVSSG